MDYKAIIIEGPIGSGKSVLTKELAKALGVNTLVLMEPDEKDDANPYLALYYEQPARFAFTMQVHLLSLRYEMHMLAQSYSMNGQGHSICDRSYYGDTCFAKLQLKLGFMTHREFNTYSRLYHNMTRHVLHPNICVRLLVSPETCLERIQKRSIEQTGRACESGIDKDYLVQLDEEISNMTKILRQHGVVVFDIPWDANRDTPELRESAIKGLVSRIVEVHPQNRFLSFHGRII